MGSLKIYLRADGEVAERFSRIKGHLGVKNDTEVLRSLMNWYWREHREELEPRLEHFNANEDGVFILDRTFKSPRIFQVHFKPEGAWCEVCESRRCMHVEFALSLPKVREILRKRGWKLSTGNDRSMHDWEGEGSAS